VVGWFDSSIMNNILVIAIIGFVLWIALGSGEKKAG
jgi:hypothetical protein